MGANLLSLDSILKAGKNKVVTTPDLRVKPPKATIPKPAPNMNKAQTENEGPVKPMGDMSRLKAAGQTQVVPMDNLNRTGSIKEPKFVSPSRDFNENLMPVVNILTAAQNANTTQTEQTSTTTPQQGATAADIHRSLFPGASNVTGTIEPNQLQEVVNVFTMYDPDFKEKTALQLEPVIPIPIKNQSQTPVSQGLYSYNLGEKFGDLLNFGDVKDQLEVSYKQLVAGITNAPMEIAAGLISEADKLKKSLVVAPISNLTSAANQFIKQAPQAAIQGVIGLLKNTDLYKSLLGGNVLPVQPEGVGSGITQGIINQGINAVNSALASVTSFLGSGFQKVSVIPSDGKSDFADKKSKFGVRWGVGSTPIGSNRKSQGEEILGIYGPVYNSNRIDDVKLKPKGAMPLFRGPNFRGYEDGANFNARVDRYYDFRIEAPYYLYKYHGLPLPVRQTDKQWPDTTNHYVQPIEAFLGSEYQKDDTERSRQAGDWAKYLKGDTKAVDYNARDEAWRASEDLLLISNLAEMSTVEIGNGEQLDLGLFGQTALTKRIDQIARVTTLIIEDDNHSVRKWLEAYKNYLYGPSPNPYLHRPIYLSYYRIYFWLLNYDKSIAYRRCFWGVPNYSLAMTPNEEGIKEFVVQWDIIGEDVPATTTYMADEQTLIDQYSTKTLQVTSPISGTYHDAGHPNSVGNL